MFQHRFITLFIPYNESNFPGHDIKVKSHIFLSQINKTASNSRRFVLHQCPYYLFRAPYIQRAIEQNSRRWSRLTVYLASVRSAYFVQWTDMGIQTSPLHVKMFSRVRSQSNSHPKVYRFRKIRSVIRIRSYCIEYLN